MSNYPNPFASPLAYDVAVVIVSFNTKEILSRSLASLAGQGATLNIQTIVVDNASHDGSADMVTADFPHVDLVRSTVNLGFAAANNLGFTRLAAPYVVLLNPDAFLTPGTLQRAIAQMQAHPEAALGGGQLRDLNGRPQPSARMFPSLLNEFLVLSGLSSRFPRSRLFGRFDRTWADPQVASEVDWVPGAFCIIRRSALTEIDGFDERFFLYYEEVDLCRRLQAQGYQIWYWPDLVIDHIGGASSKTQRDLNFSEHGSQLTLWRLRSAILYYRKHHGATVAWLVTALEAGWHRLRAARRPVGSPGWESATRQMQTVNQAWLDTQGGKASPARPW